MPYYEVSDIEVKQVDDDGNKAKQKALGVSIKKAFDTLLSNEFPQIRVTSADFTVNHIQNSVYDYAIDFEKVSDTVYIGRFTYRFFRDKVIELLRSAGYQVQVNVANSRVKVAFHRCDYIEHIKELSKYDIKIQEFDEIRVVGTVDADVIQMFNKLSIRYIRL